MTTDGVPEPLPPMDTTGTAGFEGSLGCVVLRNGVPIAAHDLDHRPMSYTPLARLVRWLRSGRKQ